MNYHILLVEVDESFDDVAHRVIFEVQKLSVDDWS